MTVQEEFGSFQNTFGHLQMGTNNPPLNIRKVPATTPLSDEISNKKTWFQIVGSTVIYIGNR
jgi:3-methyladenine DNA glycosylase Tag